MSRSPNPNQYNDNFENQRNQYSYADYGTRTQRRRRQREIRRRRRRSLLLRTATITITLMLLVGATVMVMSFSGDSDTVATDALGEASQEETLLDTGSGTDGAEDSDGTEDSDTEESTAEESAAEEYTYETDLTFSNILESAAEYFTEDFTSEYIVLYDLTDDQILYEKNAEDLCYPASTTKLLTAIVACEIIPEDMEITVGDEIEMIGEGSSIANLEQGYVLTLEMLLQALLLPSGNDAAYVLAVNAARIYTGDDTLSNEEAIEVFASLMNDAASQLGAEDSNFVVPDGFHDDDHYTTALDMAKIASYAYTVPLIRETVSTFSVSCTLVSGETLYWQNSNSLINPYASNAYSYLYNAHVTGMKTGYTTQAGTCLIASAEVDGHVLIAVVMDSENLYSKYEETTYLFEQGFSVLGLSY